MAPNPYANAGFAPGRSRSAAGGGPNGVQRSYASQLKEHEPLFNTYEHLQGLQRGDDALKLLRKVASMVKPIMRKRGWRVEVLAEFLPPEQNLLGLNINKGYKICIRLRYHNNPDLFLPLEQIVDTMLHELSHNVWGAHDSNFHKLWDELRDEHETLVRKGYTGEGFLSEGKRLGGYGNRMPPPNEMRRLARASAEKRKAQGALSQGSGQRLGGTPLHLQGDVRSIIADQATRRNRINQGCASGRKDASTLSEQASNNTFKTKAEEDDANNRAIAQALFELMEQEEEQKLSQTFQAAPSDGGLAWDPQMGLYDKDTVPPPANRSHQDQHSEDDQMKWAMQESLRSASTEPTTAFKSPPPVRSNDFGSTPPPIPMSSKPGSLQRSEETRAVDRQAQDPSSKEPGRRPSFGDVSRSLSASILDVTELPNPHDYSPSQDQWTCEVCTCINPLQFLACDACGVERPQSAGGTKSSQKAVVSEIKSERSNVRSQPIVPKKDDSLGWNCGNCGAFMEHKWWTCSACGLMKASS